MALTAGQKQLFDERGCFHLGPLFSDAELAEISQEYDRLLAAPLKLREKGKSPFHFSTLLHLQSPLMQRYVCDPRMVEPAVDLLGPDVRLYWDQGVSKPAGATSFVPWHQDNGYTPVQPEQYVTYTVALDATTPENGCLYVQPGSHRAGVIPHEPTDMVFFRGYDGDDEGEPAPQEKGDVMVFSSLTMHRSGANTSDGPRRSWIVQYCVAATRHGVSGRPFDDRLLVAEGGRVLDEPRRERPFDLSEVLQAADSKAVLEGS